MTNIKTGNYSPYPGYVAEAHKSEVSAAGQSPDEKKKTTDALNNVEHLLQCYNQRGIKNFFNPGGLEQGVHALAAAKNVMLSTGFNVEAGMPETDGPPGLAALANALIQTGKTVTFVTDSTNKPLLKACLNVLNPNAAKYCKFEVMDVDPDVVRQAERNAGQILDLRTAELNAEKEANAILDRHKPDLFLSLELNGRGAEGIAKNMRGKNISTFNSMCDEILNQANKREQITTVAVGDGGNEAGMAQLPGIPNAMDDTPMQARTEAGIQVTSWNSNLGGEALASGLLAKHGKLDALHTAEQQKAMIQAVLDGGGVDGVTRGKILGEPSKDGLGRSVQTGVDGFKPEVHAGMLAMLRNTADTIPPDNGLIAKAAVKEKPFQIAAFDSGAGGLVAARNLAGFIKHRSNRNARFIAITDFGNSPYGPKSRDDLVHLVGMGLQTADTVGVDVIAMACNTACTAFPEAKLDIGPPVLDLIKVTAEAIAEHGGKKPVVLSTEGTAKNDRYENSIKGAAHNLGKELPDVVRLGAGDKADSNEEGKDWATHINNVLHLSTKPEDQAELTRVINKYVDKIPADASSVWLCCTHYPAWKERIEDRLQERGLGHIEVIDPMEYQADALIKLLDEEAANTKGKGKEQPTTPDKETMRANRTDDTKPLVITSGKIAEAAHAANNLLRSPEGARILSGPLTGKTFDLELIAPHMYRYDLKSPSRTSFGSTHELWEIAPPQADSQVPNVLNKQQTPFPSAEGSDSANGSEGEVPVTKPQRMPTDDDPTPRPTMLPQTQAMDVKPTTLSTSQTGEIQAASSSAIPPSAAVAPAYVGTQITDEPVSLLNRWGSVRKAVLNKATLGKTYGRHNRPIREAWKGPLPKKPTDKDGDGGTSKT